MLHAHADRISMRRIASMPCMSSVGNHENTSKTFLLVRNVIP